MKSRRWTAEEKAAIVLEDLKMQKERQKSVESGRYQEDRRSCCFAAPDDNENRIQYNES